MRASVAGFVVWFDGSFGDGAWKRRGFVRTV